MSRNLAAIFGLCLCFGLGVAAENLFSGIEITGAAIGEAANEVNPQAGQLDEQARYYFERGMSNLETGRYESGIEQLLTAYELKPHPHVLFNLGHAYRKSGNVEQARAYYARYLESDPSDKEQVSLLLEGLAP